MKDVIRMFLERVEEINVYFSFLENIMVKEAKVVLSDGKSHEIDINLAQILRANGFLLLYNLVESSMSQSIEAIHREVLDKGINYDSVSRLVKREILNHFKKNVNTDNFIDSVNSIATDILKFYPQSRGFFSGNVDAREVKSLSEKYGFSCKTNARKTKNGKRLLTVKTRRNDLSHGFVSFQECGKDYTIQEMIETKEEVVQYIEGVLNNIDDYLKLKKYLKTTLQSY